jgi:NADPH2:quinone reductase
MTRSRGTRAASFGRPLGFSRGVNAVVVDRSAPGGLSLRAVAEPTPLPSQALVRVAAISLNRGEVRRARAAEDGWRPGWDIAGTVERAAADGSGPKAGARVVGLLDTAAWAETVAVPTVSLAELPASVSFEEAATLPVAGLTALYTLEKRGSLLGRRVLITGASGGVGIFAAQLARLGGAHATALVHTASKRDAVVPFADAVVVGDTADAAKEHGPFDIVLESVGGAVFSSALTLLRADGTLVTFGTSAEPTSTINVQPFYAKGGLTIVGFILFHELPRQPAGAGLERLVALLAQKKLQTRIDDVLPFARIGEAAERLWNRGVTGKLVLTL